MPVVTKEEGLQLLRETVARFAANEKHYRSGEFDEESTREQFINSFFDALGWDVVDRAGRGPHRDVIFHPRLIEEHEAAGEEAWDQDLTEEELAARNPVTQVPDYAFRVGGAIRFFVEAKRAGVSSDARPSVHQLKSYAWSQRTRVGVLTNFRQLRVYETLARPAYDQPRAGLLDGLELDYTEYEANWDRLWDLLSREAVHADSIERAGRDRRGQIAVDEAFLGQLNTWREELAADLAARNEDLDRWQLTEATQRILDRLIFLRVCEDRTVEQQVVLRRYARITDAYHQLRTEFRRLDVVYNGALFAAHFSEQLEVSDAVLQRIIAGLYFPYRPYRFDVIGPELLGAAYERFLGKEIDLDARRRVSLEDKPEVRHAGGVYYTPPWVVEEIVAQTVGPLLEGRTPRTAEQLRIVDPSCGSGSFLLGVLEYLIGWHEAYYTANRASDPERHYPASDGTRKLTSDAKADIVKRNIFGVDIDRAAVEVAQMSLYLKILEAETSATLHERPRLFPGPYLPSLNDNIRSGNSLLAAADVPQELLFDGELRRRINPFDWRDAQRGFGRVFAERGGFDAVVGNPPYTRAQVMRRYRSEETARYELRYSTAGGSWDIATLFIERGLELLRPPRQRDRGGRLGYIVTRTFAETDAARPLREMLAAGRNLHAIVDFGAGLAFDGVGAYTVLLQATKQPNRQWHLTRVPAPPASAGLAFARRPGSPLNAPMRAADLDGEEWTLSLPAEQALLDRLAARHRDLQAVTGRRIFQGVITGHEDVYRCVDVGPHPSDPSLRLVQPNGHQGGPIAIEQAALRRVVAGSNDLKRFRFAPSAEWIIFPYERDDDSDPYRIVHASRMAQIWPLTYDWLLRHRDALKARSPQSTSQPWNDENWIAYARRQNLERFAQPKVLVPYMVKELNGTVDPTGDFGYFVNVTTGGYGLQLPDDPDISLEFLAAVLSSELLSWMLKRRARAWRGEWMGARGRTLGKLSIVEPDADVQHDVVTAFQTCRRLAVDFDAAVTDADTEQLGRMYDGAVAAFDRKIFDLYEISDDELLVIRSA